MKASTLKALILHTADDDGNPGPDYRYGWGIMNTQAAADLLINYAESNGDGYMVESCLLYTSPSPRDLSTSRMPSSA